MCAGPCCVPCSRVISGHIGPVRQPRPAGGAPIARSRNPIHRAGIFSRPLAPPRPSFPGYSAPFYVHLGYSPSLGVLSASLPVLAAAVDRPTRRPKPLRLRALRAFNGLPRAHTAPEAFEQVQTRFGESIACARFTRRPPSASIDAAGALGRSGRSPDPPTSHAPTRTPEATLPLAQGGHIIA